MSKKKILVIDDDAGFVRLNESLLKGRDYEVVSAEDGIVGLKKALEEKPDLIFLDIILPEMHGFEVCKRLKADQETKDIPVIFVTSSGLEEIARNEPTIKADGYITKPYGLETLLKVISQIEAKQL